MPTVTLPQGQVITVSLGSTPRQIKASLGNDPVSVEVQAAKRAVINAGAVINPVSGISVTVSPLQGPKGADAVGIPWQQNQASSTWIIPHNLNRPYVNVSIWDSSGNKVDGDCKVVDSNTVALLFTAPFAGTAYIS